MINSLNNILYIIGTNEKRVYIKEYKNAKRELRRLMPIVLKHQLIPLKNKVKIIV